MEGFGASSGTLLKAYNSIQNIVRTMESDAHAAKVLKVNLASVWNIVYDLVVINMLQHQELGEFENLLKLFVRDLYEFEIFLDKYELKVEEQKGASVIGKINLGVSNFIKQIFSGGKIEQKQKMLSSFMIHWQNIDNNLSTPTQQSSGIQSIHHDPYFERVKIIGRESETNLIVKMLLSSEAEAKIGVSIMGMCGLGKSALARTIRDDPRIKENFFCEWFNIKDGEFVWNDIKIKMEKCFREFQRTKVAAQYEDGQKAQKLLIVFDNLLNVHSVEWQNFLAYTKDKGSPLVKVIITTRHPIVSKYTNTVPYYLKILPDILCQKVIEENAERPFKPSFLVNMAEQCKGLPWIAQRLGNIQGQCDDEGRIDFRKTKLWHTDEFKSEFLPQLAVIYKDMMRELKRCFAYFSLFPVNHRFNLDDLVLLWVGEGFVEEEETGKDYVDELIRRCLIIPADGQGYKLQSFGHYFAELAALGTCLLLDQVSSLPSSNEKIENIRHLSLACPMDKDCWSKLTALRLRSLMCFYVDNNDHRSFEQIPYIMKKPLKDVRVCSLAGTNVVEVPVIIEKSRRLRHFDVSYTPIKVLPKTLHKLRALRTLRVKGLKCLLRWNSNFHKQRNLSYVDWEPSDIREKGVPCRIGKVTRLKSLPLFQVGTGDGYSIRELKDLNALEGSLCIENLELVPNEAEAGEAMLDKKDKLERITLQWTSQSVLPSIEVYARNKGILTALKPSEKLEELIIKNYMGDDLPEWLSESNIEKLQLIECSFSGVPGLFATALGKMKQLKTLTLEDMESIDFLRCHSDSDADTVGCFPKLESLEVHNMTQLKGWSWTGVGNSLHMPCLCELKFVNCPKIAWSLWEFKTSRISDKNLKINYQFVPNTIEIGNWGDTSGILLRSKSTPSFGRKEQANEESELLRRVASSVF